MLSCNVQAAATAKIASAVNSAIIISLCGNAFPFLIEGELIISVVTTAKHKYEANPGMDANSHVHFSG